MRKSICLAGVVVLMFVVAGCGKLYGTAQGLQRWDNLPKSLQTALLAKNLIGMSAWCSTGDAGATNAYMALIKNGASRAKSQKSADLVVTVVTVTLNLSGTTNIVISDRAGNVFFRPPYPFSNDGAFGDEVADTIGAERKVALLNH